MTFTMALSLIAAEAGEKGLLQDTNVWVLVSFLIVVGVLWRVGAFGMVGKALDGKAQKAADELEAARKIREEAAELLATYQRRQREAEEEAASIIEQAKRDAKRMSEEMREKLDDQLARRTAAAEAKIARAEAQAISEIRGRTADISVQAAETLLREDKTGLSHKDLIDSAIGDLSTRLN